MESMTDFNNKYITVQSVNLVGHTIQVLVTTCAS